MIDTVKFDIPITLTGDEMEEVKWTKKSVVTDDGNITTIFLTLKDESLIGSPYISYTHKEHDQSLSWLRVEVSLPKLRHGTNFYELDDQELEWTLLLLKYYLVKNLRVPISRIPSVDKWQIKKLHLCKNFNVGQDMQLYLNAASKTVIGQHKIHTYSAKGEDRLQTVMWKASTRTEKVYNKFDEINDQSKHHEDHQSLLKLAEGTLRYEAELSADELQVLYIGKSTLGVLKSKTIIPKINRSLNRLNLNQQHKNSNLVDLIKAIENESSIPTSTKTRLIAFGTKLVTLGESACKASYSLSGYKKVKAQFKRVIGGKTINSNKTLPGLHVTSFDYAKFK